MQADVVHAHATLTPIVNDRRSRGATITLAQLEAAAKLLVDLWIAASRHGITPDHRAWTVYLPRTALDTVTAKPARSHSHAIEVMS